MAWSLPLKKWILVVLTLLLAGCAPTLPPATQTPVPTPVAPTATQAEPAEPAEAALPAPEMTLPAAGAVPGWSQTETQVYDPDTLFDFMNGAADLYFTYGFESLAVRKYEDADEKRLRVEVYRTATYADAFGLFTYNSFGEPLDLGLDGRWASGTGMAFWGHRTFVQVIAPQVDDEALRAFAEAVASALPAGGERPAVVDALPVEGLKPGSVRFFREQMALENFLWLGPDDVLGLGPDVEGVLAEYDLDGQAASLLLVAFPDDQRTQDARSGLEIAGVDDLVATMAQGEILGAVFGQLAQESASALLDRAFAAFD